MMLCYGDSTEREGGKAIGFDIMERVDRRGPLCVIVLALLWPLLLLSLSLSLSLLSLNGTNETCSNQHFWHRPWKHHLILIF